MFLPLYHLRGDGCASRFATEERTNIRQLFYYFSMATYQQWSQSYFDDLTLSQHDANNQWFQSMRDKLTDSGILHVPILDKEFNKSGEEV